MKVFGLFNDRVDIFALGEYGTDPFHMDLLGLFNTREKAEKEARQRGLSLIQRRYANEDGKFGIIKEIEVQ